MLELILTAIRAQVKSVVNAKKVIKRTQQEIVKTKKKLYYSNKIKHIGDELYKIGELKRGLYEDIVALDEYRIMKSEHKKYI